MQVTVEQEHLQLSSNETFSKISAEVEASYGGLFYFGNGSGGFSKSDGNNFLTKDGSKLKISFKIRKVLIQRSWMDPTIMQYPTIEIKGLDPGTWSTGSLIPEENLGTFPLLPTAMIVAKDIEISADELNQTLQKVSPSVKVKI